MGVKNSDPEEQALNVRIKMKDKKKLGMLLISALMLSAVLVLIDNMKSKGENSALSKAVFYVS